MVLAATMSACGGSASGGAAAPAFAVRGTQVVVNSTAAFTQSVDFPSRVESTVDAALGYWGGTWNDVAGKTLVFESEQHVTCEGSPNAIGCYDGAGIRVSTRDVGSTFYCVEETVLVHEIGHAVIGDPNHTDPRWMDFAPVLQALDGRSGYDATGPVPCRLFVNVWRHPPAIAAAIAN